MTDIIDRLNSNEWCDAVDDAIEIIKSLRGEVGGLRADIGILTAERDTLKARLDRLALFPLKVELERLTAENLSLREALEFYANNHMEGPVTWKDDECTVDQGDVARAALKSLDKRKETK